MKGMYFKSDKDNTSHFLLTYKVNTAGHNCIVTIYDIKVPQKNLKNGEPVEDFEPDLFVTIDIWNKYYFPEFFNVENQWYHNYNGKEDRIGAIHDVMKYAIDLGINKGRITLY